MRKKEDYLIMGKGYGKGFVKAAAITYLFYRSIVFSVLSGVLFGFPGIYMERKKEREKYSANLRSLRMLSLLFYIILDNQVSLLSSVRCHLFIFLLLKKGKTFLKKLLLLL